MKSLDKNTHTTQHTSKTNVLRPNISHGFVLCDSLVEPQSKSPVRAVESTQLARKEVAARLQMHYYAAHRRHIRFCGVGFRQLIKLEDYCESIF